MGLVWELGKLLWWAIVPAGEHVIQVWVLFRLGKVVPPVDKCVGFGTGQIGQGCA